MKRNINEEHPLWMYFGSAVHESLHNRLGLREFADVETYLTNMLVEFLHQDGIFSIKDSEGRPVRSVAEMLAEGDIRMNADSFDREREVHRHIGDFLLFWSGLFPEYLQQSKLDDPREMFVDATQQGRFSYHVVSTFEHDPYGEEAETFRKMSAKFDALQNGLRFVRASFEGFALQGWTDGFEA